MADSPFLAPGGTAPGTTTQNTNYTYDPSMQFLSNILRGSYGSNGMVSPTVTGGIENLISNPGAVGNIAGQQFHDIAAPLLQEQQAGFRMQENNLRDMFRKNGVGSLQSGAFAQAGKQQVADEGRQQNSLLASSYIPLTQNLANQQIAGVNAGLKVPSANYDTLANLLNAYGRAPLSSDVTKTGVEGLAGGSLRAGGGGTGWLDQPFVSPTAPDWWNAPDTTPQYSGGVNVNPYAETAKG